MKMTNPENSVEAGLTAGGTRLLSRSELYEVLEVAERHNLIICNVEAFESDGHIRRLSMEHSHSFVDDRPDVQWVEKVSASVLYTKQMIARSPQSMIFKVWLQAKAEK